MLTLRLASNKMDMHESKMPKLKDMHMTDKPKPTHSSKCTDHGMKFGHYYVVEASFFQNNPVHRYIACQPREDTVTLLSGGFENYNEHVKLSTLAFFQVVEEITALQDKVSRVMPFDEVQT